MTRYLHQRFGDYRLVRLLGSGGFAEVYEADHLHLHGIKAAIKLLKGNVTPQQIGELRKEAYIVSSLNHPHIVPLRTFSIENSVPYLVMSYAQGGTLDKQYPLGIRLTFSEIISYICPIAQALQYAHQHQIVHRDLKPTNLLLTQDGVVQVADFGIAVVVHSSTSRTIQEVAGTWAYMAPEQFHGLAEPATDQYALAIIVYQWLCGNLPFDGNGNAYLIPQQQLEQPPPSLSEKLPDLSSTIEYVVMKALSKRPEERFATIQEFAEALAEADKPPFVPVPGQRIGDYQIKRKLGEGGFAEVYEAEHLHLGTQAAIKLLKGTFSSKQVEELRREARSVMQLDHPHIIRAYGFSIEREIPYLILAYASGGSLATRYPQGTRLPLEIILEYVRQITAALQYAHDQGIIHRDIKPDNILLAQDGRIQVTDFGIAVMTQATQPSQEIVGSWIYMAPEQFEGRAEAASDQYSLGIMIYQWLCGEPPFAGKDNIYILPYQQMHELPPSLHKRLPALSYKVEQVVMKALAKKPEERFASIHVFTQALEEACKLAADMTLLIYEHHGGVVRTVAWSPDGAHIATGGEDATVRLWNVLNGQTKLTYHGHSSSVNMIAWSPNGRLIASGCIDRTVQIWEVASGKLLHSHECQYTWANVAWSPNSQLIASTSNDGIRSGKAIYDTMIQVWEAISGKNVTNYRGHTALINAIAWSPDGQRVASGGADNSVQIWEVTTGKLLCRYEDDSSAVNVIMWSPNSLRVALGKCDGTVQIWTITTGKLIYCHKEDKLENIPVLYIGIPLSVQAIVWSPDSQLIASAHSGNSVEIWQAATGKFLSQYDKDHSPKASTGALVWLDNWQLMVSKHNDRVIEVWEATSSRLLSCYNSHAAFVNVVAWSPDGNLVASGSNSSVQVWDVASNKLKTSYEGHMDLLNTIAWSPDGKLIASGSGEFDSSVQVWEVASGKCLYEHRGHREGVNAVSWSPDGRFIASGGSGEVHVWEAISGKLLCNYSGHFSLAHIMAWPSDRRPVSSEDFDNSGQVWGRVSSKLRHVYEDRDDEDRDDGYDEYGAYDGYDEYDVYGSYYEHNGYDEENVVAWSPNGQLVASGNEETNTIEVWEATSGRSLYFYNGHTDHVNVVTWSPNGQLIASGGNDGTVQIWESLTGKLLLTYRSHLNSVFALAWSPDGMRIVSASYAIHVWQVGRNGIAPFLEG